MPNQVHNAKLHAAFADAFESLLLLPSVITPIVAGYWIWLQYNPKPTRIEKLRDNPYFFSFDPQLQHLYLSNSRPSLITYDTEFQKVETPFSASKSKSVLLVTEINQNKLYALTYDRFITFNLLTGEQLFEWEIKLFSGPSARKSFKIDTDEIYCTISPHQQVFVFSMQGTPMRMFGLVQKESPSPFLTSTPKSCTQAFHNPRGVTVVNHQLYICDEENHRVVILNKIDGELISLWSNFRYPLSVLHFEGILYFGDYECFQLMTEEGILLQRIGSSGSGGTDDMFNAIFSLAVLGDKLYISDHYNKRIKVFQQE